jgi:hypothetical protein
MIDSGYWTCSQIAGKSKTDSLSRVGLPCKPLKTEIRKHDAVAPASM